MRLRAATLVVLAICVLAACKPAPPRVSVTPSGPATTAELFTSLNTLTGHTYVRDARADGYAQSVANRLAGGGICGNMVHSTPTQLLAWYPSASRVGENLFCMTLSAGCPVSQSVADSTVRAWVASPEHKQVLDAFAGKFVGLGASCANGGAFFAVAQFHT